MLVFNNLFWLGLVILNCVCYELYFIGRREQPSYLAVVSIVLSFVSLLLVIGTHSPVFWNLSLKYYTVRKYPYRSLSQYCFINATFPIFRWKFRKKHFRQAYKKFGLYIAFFQAQALHFSSAQLWSLRNSLFNLLSIVSFLEKLPSLFCQWLLYYRICQIFQIFLHFLTHISQIGHSSLFKYTYTYI